MVLLILKFLSTALLAVIGLLLIAYLIKLSNLQNDIRTLIKGIKTGLNGTGLAPKKPRYPLELYQWITMDNDEVCEDCLDRATWLPMDIAGWMKEGLPRTPEAHTECGDQCRCELVLVKPKQHIGNKR